jgi:hypothetical protein
MPLATMRGILHEAHTSNSFHRVSPAGRPMIGRPVVCAASEIASRFRLLQPPALTRRDR